MAKKIRVKIGKNKLGVVLEKIGEILGFFLELPDDMTKGRKGGYFSVFDEIYESPLAIIRIGKPDINLAKDYFEFSPEKAIRLRALAGDLSSWQSRDDKNKKWGGSIRTKTPEIILSFSGLPELADEAIMLLTAYHFDWINYNQLWQIQGISNNPYVEPLYRKLWGYT